MREKGIPNGSSGQRHRRMILPLLCAGMELTGRKKNTHNQHLSVLDYKKQERANEVAALAEELEGAQVVLELKEERIESLDKEIEDKHVSIRKEQSEASKDAG